jgi:hypothetical protein
MENMRNPFSMENIFIEIVWAVKRHRSRNRFARQRNILNCSMLATAIFYRVLSDPAALVMKKLLVIALATVLAACAVAPQGLAYGDRAYAQPRVLSDAALAELTADLSRAARLANDV